MKHTKYNHPASVHRSFRMSLRWTTAIVRDVPDSFVHAVRKDESQKVNLQVAKWQHRNYVKTLESCGVEVVRLPADEDHPDCTFVEDNVIVIGRRALITRTGHVTRRGEVVAMKEALKKLKTQIEIFEMEREDPEAHMDGGDVLFTGREILVGNSFRTNEKGIQCLARIFPQYHVTSFPVRESLHLKCLCSMGGEGQIIIGGDREATDIMKQMQARARFNYDYIQVDNNAAATALLVNDHLITKPDFEIGHGNYEMIKSRVRGKVVDVPFGEFYKVEGCLTCCSVLINENHLQQSQQCSKI